MELAATCKSDRMPGLIAPWPGQGGGEKKLHQQPQKKERGEEAPMPRTVRGLPQTSSPASSAEKREGGVVVFIAERGKKALLDVGYNFLGTK